MPAPHSPTPLQARIPNLLTALRLLLTLLFVIILSLYRVQTPPDLETYWGEEYFPIAAAILFTLAALTDALDGYLARKWNAVSVLGRVMDPFADKVLILSAFILLASPAFYDNRFGQLSGVYPWMVIFILSRELLITSLRAVAESKGADFSATLSGKLKMIAQSIAVPLILLLITAPYFLGPDTINSPTVHRINIITAWSVTLITAWSAIPYITRALRVLRPAPPTSTTELPHQ
ncbi:MAG: CDP-diacylglycerol--glycerol-3-phosphate 3-phosphatidyltransferase [Phycisphaerales bacterium]